jgi:hypothetical protein
VLIKEHGTRAGHRGCRAVVAEDEPRRSGAAATEAKVQAEAEPRWYRTNFAQERKEVGPASAVCRQQCSAGGMFAHLYKLRCLTAVTSQCKASVGRKFVDGSGVAGQGWEGSWVDGGDGALTGAPDLMASAKDALSESINEHAIMSDQLELGSH